LKAASFVSSFMQYGRRNCAPCTSQAPLEQGYVFFALTIPNNTRAAASIEWLQREELQEKATSQE